MKSILMLWYMEDDNFGDVLILKTVSDFLKKKGYYIENHEVGDYVYNIINHANACDFLLFAGGGIIERYVPDVIRNIDKLISGLRVPYGVMGIGMGIFDYSDYSAMMKKWVDNALFFYVRDLHTKELLYSYSNNEKVKYSSDCVFYNSEVKRTGVKEKIGINVRDMPYKDLTGDLEWEKINEYIKKYQIDVIIPDSSKEAYNILQNKNEENKLNSYKNLSKYEKIKKTTEEISKCKWIIAMRFHVILVAALLGIPCIALNYCPKVEYLMYQLGLAELLVETNELDKIPQKIEFLLTNRKNIDIILERNVANMRGRANDMFDSIEYDLNMFLRGEL